MSERRDKEPWQEGMHCPYRDDGVCIANCEEACICFKRIRTHLDKAQWGTFR
jgi:hypothetical protein